MNRIEMEVAGAAAEEDFWWGCMGRGSALCQRFVKKQWLEADNRLDCLMLAADDQEIQNE